LRLARLPAYSPDFNADEHIWARGREEVTANTCVGPAAQVRAHVDPSFTDLAARADEVKQRRRTALQNRAAAVEAGRAATPISQVVQQAAQQHGDRTLASLQAERLPERRKTNRRCAAASSGAPDDEVCRQVAWFGSAD
jgi:hypothetical protein